MTRNCATCEFSKLGKRKDYDNADYVILECHRYAPRHISGVGTGYEKHLFPQVEHDDWCGEYCEDEDAT